MSFVVTMSLVMGFLSFESRADSKTEYIVIDVRTSGEYAEGHVEGALNMDIYESSFRARLSALDKSKSYKVYCRSGNRSGQAERLMKSMGFKDVENMGSLGQALRKTKQSCKGKLC
ncbi:MAG: rhodanese-like domain-containing protein [Bdellovibrionales bacterium]|jgi:rhodanese-related sulfurtransferase|nr:rhodanese-like domain-containing protein [Bdellovibrionales bacterium]